MGCNRNKKEERMKKMNQKYKELCKWGESKFQKMYLVEDENHRTWMKKLLPVSSFPLYNVLLGINHINLVQVHDVWTENETCIVIEEFVNGNTLSEYMQLLERTCFSVEEALSYTEAVCDGLYELHRHGIIHRDIKPENLMITNDGIIKISDYNIARLHRKNAGSDTQILGTQGFAAPEQFGYRQTDARSDIYAVGVLLNVLLTGKMPLESPYQERKDICQIIKGATAIDPKERYADVKRLRRDVRKARKKVSKGK